jgi:hypothetical protein
VFDPARPAKSTPELVVAMAEWYGRHARG